jgi:hypothetical protein
MRCRQLFLFVVALLAGATLWAQTQLGNNILSEGMGDYCGSAVALSEDGNRLLVGARRNSGVSNGAGHVRVFEWNGTTWSQVGDDIDGLSEENNAGWSGDISADGTRIAVGEPYYFDSDGQIYVGQVRIFDWSGTEWQQLGEAIIGKASSDNSGQAVSLSADGTRVAIGAPGNNGFTGQIRIYEWNGMAWAQLGQDIDGEASPESFGRTIALSGDGQRVIAGAPMHEVSPGTAAGYAKVFEWDGTNWVPLGSTITETTAAAGQGWSVDIDGLGNRIAVGGIYHAGKGRVYVYDWDGTQWTQTGAHFEGQVTDEGLGYAVSLSGSGNRLAIGSPTDNLGGHVTVFDWTGTTWEQVGVSITGNGETIVFGGQLDLSGNGNRIAIGDVWNMQNGVFAGMVSVYQFEAVGLHSLSAAHIKVYPNPTTGLLTLDGMTEGWIKIIDQTGKVVFDQAFTSNTIDLSHLPNGLYYLQLFSDQRWLTGRLVKM